jgi:N-ethylmaleimide reductase
MELFTPVTLGDIELANRVVMAPLTRMRAGASGVPNDLVVEHYAQRAGLGLIVSEATYVRREGQAFVGQPGLVDAEQTAGWARVAEAVHVRGGKIVVQLQHGGRASHRDVNGGRRVEAPSAIAAPGEAHTEKGKQPYPVPHALTTEELVEVRQAFVTSAERAIEAGLDGVEVHGANGYLLHEFLAPSSNQREDAYGGSPGDRARFVVEVVTAVAAAVGPGRVGLRISPEVGIQGVLEPDRDDVLATYGTLLDQLAPLGLAYLSVLHPVPGGDLVQELRRRSGGPLVVNTGFGSATTREEAAAVLAYAHADAVAVGRPVIANPDLVERWRGEHPENATRPQFFYTSGAEGYTDYPLLATTGS